MHLATQSADVRALIRPDVLCAWKGSALLVVNTRGECDSGLELSGYYYREARCLRTLRLEINGERPWLCEAAAVAPDTLQFTYIHPEVARYGGGGSGQSADDTPADERGLPQRGLILSVTYQLRLTGLLASITIENHARETLAFEVAWALDADFVDLQEAQEARRRQNAPVRIEPATGSVTFRYGHSELSYSTLVGLPPEFAWDEARTRAVAGVRLSPSDRVTLELEIDASDGRHALSEHDVLQREAHLESWRQSFTQVNVPGNRVFEAVLAHNIRDFASFPLVDGNRDEWLTLQAGVPLYPAIRPSSGATR